MFSAAICDCHFHCDCWCHMVRFTSVQALPAPGHDRERCQARFFFALSRDSIAVENSEKSKATLHHHLILARVRTAVLRKGRTGKNKEVAAPTALYRSATHKI